MDWREHNAIGISRHDDTVLISILEAGEPAVVYYSGNIDIAVDKSWNLAGLRVRNVHCAQLDAVMSSVLTET